MVGTIRVQQLFCCVLGCIFACNVLEAVQDRRPSLPYVSGDGFRFCSDFIWDETGKFNPANVKKPSVIFVKTDLLEDFFTNCHPHLKYPYVLISHNSDYGAPGDYLRYLDDPKLKHWFGQNPTIREHSKFTAIPIGIMNRYCNPWPDLQPLIALQKKLNTVVKKHFIYVNFSIGTCYKLRQSAYEFFSKNPRTVIFKLGRKWPEYLNDLARSEFVISPPGNGLDCHRTWEALLVGAVPVIVDTNLTPLLRDLPVITVPNWEVCTDEFLMEELQKIRQKNYDLEKLYMSFWEKRIRTALYS